MRKAPPITLARVPSIDGPTPERVVVIGTVGEDEELYVESSIANGPEVLWLLEKVRQRLMEV